MLLDSYVELIAHEFSEFIGSRKPEDIFTLITCEWLSDKHYCLYPICPDKEYPSGSIAYCEKAYEKGWEAIINDGKLLGFKKAV